LLLLIAIAGAQSKIRRLEAQPVKPLVASINLEQA
jgi:hypothetical protein